MKDYIKDEGIIRNCDYNISQMNILGYIIFDVRKGFFKYNFLDTIKLYVDSFKNLGGAIINTIFIIMFPIVLIIRAILGIKNAKRKVEEYKIFNKI